MAGSWLAASQPFGEECARPRGGWDTSRRLIDGVGNESQSI
jgi:hypothetical protein